MINFLEIDIPNWIESGLRTLFYGLCSMLYRLVIGMYDIFELLCTVRILDMDVVDSLAQRIGLILGLVMLFIVIFSLINSLINPDLLTDKAKSPVNLIKKVLLVIMMFGLSSFAFNGLYYVQNVVIKSNVVVKLFVPAQVSNDNFGNLLTKEMFMSFYTINEEVEGSSDDEVAYCEDVIDALGNNILSMGRFEMGRKCLDKTIKVGDEKVFIIDFSYLYSLIVAGFLVYFIFMYCLNIGVRTFQLVFLEIISPMAFVGYLSPKNDNMFSRWIKMYFSTYIDIFIRIGIISFVTFIISAVLGNGTDYGNLVEVIAGTSGFTKTLLEILLIFALLTFAKKAPDLLKVLFPSGDSKLGFGISSPKKMFDNMLGGNLVRGGMIGAAGLGVGAAVGGIGNAIRARAYANKNELTGKERAAFLGNSILSGIGAGALGGAKAKGVGKAFGASNKAALGKNQNLTAWLDNGGESYKDRRRTAWQQRLGMTTEADRRDLEKARLEAENSAYKAYDGYIDAAEKRAEGQILKGAFNDNEHAKEALRQKSMAEIYRQQSSNVKRSDFAGKSNELSYYKLVEDTYDINKDAAEFQTRNDDTGKMEFDIQKYTDAVKAAIDADTNESNKHLATFDSFVNKNYEDALQFYADEASKADSKYLTEMKKAKSDYISEQLRIARDEGIENADAPTIQNLQQAAGVIEANMSNSDYNFVEFKRDSNGDVIKDADGKPITVRITKEALLNGSYVNFDDVNANAKSRQSDNNNKLAADQVEGKAARADSKYSGVDKK